MIANPWTAIGSSPAFVLDEDQAYIDAFNSRCTPNSKAWINSTYTPEPRLGPVSAPVIILQANPSYQEAISDGSKDRQVVDRELESLRKDDSPHLGVAFESNWWRKTLGQLIREVGAEKLARRICSVEFFPYRSLKFSHGHIRLPSQRYTFDLVERFLREKRLIVLTRAAAVWLGAVPGLAAAMGNTVFQSANAQRTFITPGNLPPGVYDRIVRAVVAD